MIWLKTMTLVIGGMMGYESAAVNEVIVPSMRECVAYLDYHVNEPSDGGIQPDQYRESKQSLTTVFESQGTRIKIVRDCIEIK
jgi:methylaspartate ammonia-lyase